MASKNQKKPESQSLNIQAFIRVRPLTSKEKKTPHLHFSKKEVAIGSAEGCRQKTLSFDRVFEEDVKQVIVYKTVVKPMIKEVLQGYNCTVFAYGQTGTGKTYTMTGDQGDSDMWDDNTEAGLIPRAMEDIFIELLGQVSEYQVSVSYLELYNEKLRSLLSDFSEETNIQMIDDLEGGVILRELTPTPVKTKQDAFKLLQQGMDRRQTAATLMNMSSSRSHSIFTITVTVKESIPGDTDDILRVGKLHLVDLAGSENVSKSGANETKNKNGSGMNRRLTEASNINKSLLTLGRVITSITENSPHIPYRESKLTRFLRDSLGGKTKTCIIGTISPAQSNLDETESTLNYACKARSIKNKPEKNQKISKKEFMQIASDEIQKLRRDLEAVRQGDGFYISQESHEEMLKRMQELDAQVKEWNGRYNNMKDKHEDLQDLYSSLSAEYDDKCTEYDELEKVSSSEIEKLKKETSEMKFNIKLRDSIIKQYEKTEGTLTKEAKACKSVLEILIDQGDNLHDKIDRKVENESSNMETLADYKEKVNDSILKIEEKLHNFNLEEMIFSNRVAISSGHIMDYINDECRAVIEHMDATIKSSQTCCQTLFSRHYTSTEKMGEELYHQIAILEEGINNEKNGLMNLMSIVVEPEVTKLNDQVSLMEKAVCNAKQSLAKFSKKTVEIQEGLAQSHTRLKEFEEEVGLELQCLKSYLTESFVMMKTTSDNASEAFAKASELRSLVEQFDKVTIELNEKTKAVVDSVKSTQDNFMKVEIAAEKSAEAFVSNLEEFETEAVVAIGKACQHRDNLHQYMGKVVNKVQVGLENLQKDNYRAVANIEAAVNKRVNAMEKHSIEERKNVKVLTDLLVSHTGEVNLFAEAMKNDTESRLVNLIERLKLFDDECEKRLREHTTHVSTHLNSAKDQTDGYLVAFTDLKLTVDDFSYSQYIPSGQSPQRLDRQTLVYPREFQATAPREALIEMFKEQMGIEAKKHDEAIPAMSSKQAPKTEPRPLPGTRLRRSLSMPDVNASSGRCKTKCEENKENSVTSKAKKQILIKGKTGNTKSTKSTTHINSRSPLIVISQSPLNVRQAQSELCKD